MAWGVFYRPEQVEWRPRFKVPLSRALLSDPAFSSDPRTHPHFNTPFDVPQQPRQMPRPRLTQRPPQISRKASMKALVRRLTSHHNLDRIDELDETDPFGTSHHHDGPYEAIGSTQAQPVDVLPRTNVHHSKRAFNPRSLHPIHHQSLPRAPSIRCENGLSLHLKPGQILQHNTIYTSHMSSVTPVSNRLSRQYTPTTVSNPDTSPSHSCSTCSTQDSPLYPLNDLRNRPLSLPHAPSQRYPVTTTPDIHILPLHHNGVDVPYVPTQTTDTVFPPPRRESRRYSTGSSPSSQSTLSPSVSRKNWAMEGTEPSHDAGHKSPHSLDSSHTISDTGPRSSSNMQSKSLEPPRMRHLPKRLVMPAPLQSQPPQAQYRFSPTEHAGWKDVHCALEGAGPEGQPIVYNQGPRVLRKKSSAFPGELQIPHRVPMLQDDAVQEVEDIPTKIESEAERPKEKIRRRRLSKRKSAI